MNRKVLFNPLVRFLLFDSYKTTQGGFSFLEKFSYLIKRAKRSPFFFSYLILLRLIEQVNKHIGYRGMDKKKDSGVGARVFLKVYLRNNSLITTKKGYSKYTNEYFKSQG